MDGTLGAVMSAAGASTLVIIGSTIFLVGAAIGVPKVFLEADPQVRLAMLERRLTLWRVAQPLYVVGPLVASVGVGLLSTTNAAGDGSGWIAVSCALLVVGVAFWSGDALPRMVRHRAFALGALPWWPFAWYVWSTLVGLLALGGGLLMADIPGWVGWLTIAADVCFAVFFVVTRDIPPFFFYLLLLVVAFGWL